MNMPSSDRPDGQKSDAAEPVTSMTTSLTGELQEAVDPFDYAETIVRDLALHVGTRLRDFRSDLAAMHNAVVQLPETMKINALGQSIQELRERLAHLTGVVSQQVTRYPEELDRVAKLSSDLLNRVAGLESWIAAARQSLAQGDAPALPSPTGGFVGQDQLNAVVGQVHESLMRVVGAVRDLQLDLRDLRSDVRAGVPAGSAPPALPGDLDQRLRILEEKVVAVAKAPAPAPVVQPAAASPANNLVATNLAALVMGAWSRLAQPAGAEALRQAVDATVAAVRSRVEHVVVPAEVARGSGIVAVGTGRCDGRPLVVLVATEDLCGRTWTLGAGGMEMASAETADRPPSTRTACWRALLGAAALVEQAQPGAVVMPVLVYGHGHLNVLPSREEIIAYARSTGTVIAAQRLLCVAAADVSLPGLGRPADVASVLATLGG